MKANKKIISTILVYALLLVVFIVLTTVIPFDMGVASWTVFSFSVIAIIASCGITLYAFTKGDSVKSKLYGFSLFKLGVTYIAVQLFVCVAIYVVGAFVTVPAWIAVILCILIVAFCAIGLIVVDNTIDIIEAQDKKVEAQIKEMKTFTVNVGSIIAICKNDEFRPHLERLEEAFKYSDPVSSAQTAPLEDNIKNEIGVLTTLVAQNSELAVAKVNEIEALLSSRNAVCKLSK